MSAAEAFYDSPQPVERRAQIRVVPDDAVEVHVGKSGVTRLSKVVWAARRNHRIAMVVLCLKLGSIGLVMTSVVATGIWSFLSLPNTPLP